MVHARSQAKSLDPGLHQVGLLCQVQGVIHATGIIVFRRIDKRPGPLQAQLREVRYQQGERPLLAFNGLVLGSQPFAGRLPEWQNLLFKSPPELGVTDRAGST